jgi:signal transduction histidine kinase
MKNVNPLRSVGGRLSLAVALVVLLAVGVVYAVVVPPLERSLVDSKVDQLTRSAETEVTDIQNAVLSPSIESKVQLEDSMQNAAYRTGARVVLVDPLSSGTGAVVSDSSGLRTATALAKDPIAVRAALSGQYASGTVVRGQTRYAESAHIVVGPFNLMVALFTTPLDDTLANVELVKRRVLFAGGAALLVSILVGYGGAWLFARRLRRLERAAERIASGDLDEPVADEGRDEVGDLARAFERMRGRLAQLEHARREFIANASHELRTPIFSLGGFLELMSDEELDEPTRREFQSAMLEQVDRLGRLATDLLDLSRLDAGRLHVEHEAVDSAELADALAEEFAAVARSSSHPLTVEVAPGAPPMLADELRVLRIGRVLVENALRHTPPGTPVAVSVRPEGEHVVLAVADRGPGIAPEDLPHVFDRFYRGEGGRASGSGLGLAIAQELATVMGGELTVESRRGRTVFELRMPFAAAPATTPAALA